jgi:hypothetical protein
MMGRRAARGHLARLAAGVAICQLFLASRAEAANDALVRLLQVLRDRGSISAQEYEDIRKVAEASDAPTAQAPAPAPADTARIATVEQRVAAQEKAVAGLRSTVDGAVPPLVNKALAGKWYERIGLRGYTQFRGSNVFSEDGPDLEVPADRSVNENESLVLRRGRMIFSGDATDHLSTYAQMDFNGSTGSGDFALQMRDLYADVWLDRAKLWRVRLGQSKVPFGFVNLQSSQNRAPFERPDALNLAVEGERDLGASLMWNTAAAKQRFREVQNATLKGSGDYGVVSVGVYSGQGLNRPDQNGAMHVFGRVAYPFKVGSSQLLELGVQGYHGRFVSPTQAITVDGASITPTLRSGGVADDRVALSAIWYPQPLGFEAEWTAGRGPALTADFRRIEADDLHGGYLQMHYRLKNAAGSWLPFTRWNYYDGARKFARNAPRMKVNEMDFGVEFVHWTELELTGVYTHTFRRTRTSAFPYTDTTGADRVGVQVQWNY